ncbi:MAG: potassium transporter TrkG [Bacteroidales bacterium]|nr:potassium transporter TrkG [Bacteroidales bacterium]
MKYLIYKIGELLKKIRAPLLVTASWGAFFVSITSLIFVVYSIGFEQKEIIQTRIYDVYKLAVIFFFFLYLLRVLAGLISSESFSKKGWFSLLFLAISIFILFDITIFGKSVNLPFFYNYRFVIAVLLYVSIMEISGAIVRILSKSVHPHLIFVVSFLSIITIGTALLMFPNSTYNGISFTDALFTATSATCVTGLVSVPFSETFTLSGQLIVLFLIQTGGLGVITITTFFAVFFTRGFSVNSEYIIKDIISGNRSSKLISLVTRIITVTLIMELAGAALIYIYTAPHLQMEEWDKVYFSVFHSISAFCNAGFSTMPQNLAEPVLINIGPLYVIISILIIFGGIGFPIFSNILRISGHRIRQAYMFIRFRKFTRFVREWDMNSIIVIRTTAILIVAGMTYLLLFEWNGILSQFSNEDKIIQAFFNSVTPRTAGFNSLDTSALKAVTLYMVLIFMWIGGAPQSTAGGIKVTTFALMIRNAAQLVRGSDRVEFHGREISALSVTRAFAAVVFSLMTILTAQIILVKTNPDIEPLKLFFEAVSAIGTVGLSMGVTEELLPAGKIVITVLMFAGRVGVVTLLSAFIRSRTQNRYRYPGADILIN